MKKTKIAFAVTGGIALLGMIQYITLNAKYPEPEEHIVEFGEVMRIENYSFSLKDWKWSDGSIVDDILPGYELLLYSDGRGYPSEKEKIALATVEICKNAEDDSYLDLTNIAFEMGAWHNQWDNELFEALNGKDSLVLSLSEGEKKEIIFPIAMFDFQFTRKEWENIEARKVNIVVTCYPEKYVLQGAIG